MASKYSGLPDIDTAQDVFETADEPDIPVRPNNDMLGDDGTPVKPPRSEMIDASSLPSRYRAERKFGRAKRKDGAYQLGLPPLTGDQPDDSDDEAPARPKETPAARIRRLKAELAEIESEVAGSSSGPARPRARKSVLAPKEPVDVVAEMSSLRSRLAELDGEESDVAYGSNWSERLRHLAVPSDVTANGGAEVEGRRPTSGDSSSLSELDRRLAGLEDAIGVGGEGVDQAPSAPLISTLERVDELLALLTQPRHLDAISRRVKLLIVDLDRAAAAQRRAGPSAQTQPPSSVNLSSTEYAQMQSLFTLLPRLDPLLSILPPLLARLRSLASLHSEADQIADGLKRLNAEDQRSGEELRDLMEVVKSVQSGLEDNGKAVERNWTGLEGRMKDLEERIRKLG